MIIGITIYLIGYVLAYYLVRIVEKKEPSWYRVGNCLSWSILSWAIVILIFIGFIVEVVCDKIEETLEIVKTKFPKPPKWL